MSFNAAQNYKCKKSSLTLNTNTLKYLTKYFDAIFKMYKHYTTAIGEKD